MPSDLCTVGLTCNHFIQTCWMRCQSWFKLHTVCRVGRSGFLSIENDGNRTVGTLLKYSPSLYSLTLTHPHNNTFINHPSSLKSISMEGSVQPPHSILSIPSLLNKVERYIYRAGQSPRLTFASGAARPPPSLSFSVAG